MTNTIKLQYIDNAPLNAVADFMFHEKSRLLESLEKVEMVKGAPKLFGSGDDKIVTIILKYTNPTEEDLSDINDILTIAKNYGELNGAEEIDIVVKELSDL